MSSTRTQSNLSLFCSLRSGFRLALASCALFAVCLARRLRVRVIRLLSFTVGLVASALTPGSSDDGSSEMASNLEEVEMGAGGIMIILVTLLVMALGVGSLLVSCWLASPFT